MKYLIGFILSLLFVSSAIAATNASLPIASQSTKFFVIPIETLTKKNPDAFQMVLFKSLYTFLRLIPSLDVPEEKKLNELFWLSPVLAKWERINPDLAPKMVYEADYILYGDYLIMQKVPSEVVSLSIGVWSKEKNKNVFSKTYVTGTDVEIFDTIDAVLKNVVENVLKIDFSLARININIKSGKERYDIYINQKLVERADTANYTKSFRVLGKQHYTVSIIRISDGNEVFQDEKDLKGNGFMNVDYVANGSVVVDPVRYQERGKKYSVTVDNKPVKDNQVLEDLNALNEHVIKVYNQSTNLIYSSKFNVKDGSTMHIAGEEKWGGLFHPKFYLFGNSICGAAAQFFPERYVWLEAGMGFSVYYSQAFKEGIYNLSPYLDAGYYFSGDMLTDWRYGGGASLLYYQYLPADKFSQINPDTIKRSEVTSYSYAAGVFAVGEWQWVTLKLGLYYDFMANGIYLSPSIGVKF
jgi:hypothetical protein